MYEVPLKATPCRRNREGGVFYRHRLSIEADPRLPSQKTKPRGRRRPDPLTGVWECEIVPMLAAARGFRAVVIFEEISRRHHDLAVGVRRTEERCVAKWSALHGPSRDVNTRRAGWACRTSPT